MIRILVGDVRERLKSLEPETIQTCCTSPPYWNLRNYGIEGQIGLEATPEEYVQTMVEVFREVWRVLRKDGCLWINLGDSFAGSGGAHTKDHANPGLSRSAERDGVPHYRADGGRGPAKRGGGLKAKDLVGIPWRVAFALQDDGWWLRRDIIWHKSNPMPESVTDRPTSSHEYVFLLSKSARYFYDAEAVKEGCSENTHTRGPEFHELPKVQEADSGIKNNSSFAAATWGPVTSRNPRSVWTIPTFSFKGSHFATFPPALVEPCVKAGTSERGCCPKCRKPYRRIVEKKKGDNQSFKGSSFTAGKTAVHQLERASAEERTATAVTLGWEPSCKCQDTGEPVACTVLDIFGGSGTTGMVADRLGRDAILIELNPAYALLAKNRITADAGMFAKVEVLL